MAPESDAASNGASPAASIGDRSSFYVVSSSEERTVQIKAELRYIGEHIVFWVESDQVGLIESEDLAFLARTFDRIIYPQLRALWGSEDTPGIDGDSRIHVVFAADLGRSPTAYFTSQNTYPQEIIEGSNQREMIVLNLRSTGVDVGNFGIASVIAHEFQHMIRANIAQNTNSWLNEGFSMFSPVYLGIDDGGVTPQLFLNLPQLQLNRWLSSGANYGAGLLFVTYLYEEYGIDALQALSPDSEKGFFALDHVLMSFGDNIETFFADWAAANVILDDSVSDGRYGYNLLNGLTAPPVSAVISEYPSTEEITAFPYSTGYFELENLTSGDQITVELNADTYTQLVPTEAYSGSRMWYSNRGDDNMLFLTCEFDLSTTDQATLNYKVWFNTEALWDYGYVTVSTDNGQTWDILSTPHMTEDNPHFTAFGSAYTGASDGWLEESISLDAYAGQRVQVRFMMIHDDSTHEEGILIDDISVPEIGYFSDFENDAGGWKPQGWVWIDNRLATRIWVQVIQITAQGVDITRHLWTGDMRQAEMRQGDTIEDRRIRATIQPDAQRVIVAVSPVTPETFIPAVLTLNFSK